MLRLSFAAVAQRARKQLNRAFIKLGFPRDWFLIPLAAIVGSIAGLAAQGYGQLVHHGQQYFFGASSNHHTISSRWWLVLLVPAVGGLVVGLIKTIFRLPIISHGIPEVIEAMVRNHGRLKLKTGIFTALNSTVTLGSGGSTGQEGPIVHIGSVVGSVVGQLLRVGREHMNTLVGCGAAAGLAAIFNAPITGVLLVLEVVLRNFSLKTFMPLVIASVFGVAASQAIAEDYGALFMLPHGHFLYNFTYHEILPYVLLGVACGFGGWCFGKMLVLAEHRMASFKKLPKPIKPMLGGLTLGLLGLLFVLAYPHVIPNYDPPVFFGNGYQVVQTLITTDAYASPGAAGRITLGFLILAGLAKTVGTSLTLGSGGSGGVFAPALFIGAAFGGAFGMVVQYTGYYPHISPADYALAGTAGVLAAVVHCPLTAIILLFEITREYKVILPAMIVTIIATVISQVIMRDSIYIIALRDRGIRADALADSTLLRRLYVAQVKLVSAVTLNPQDPAQKLIDLAHQHPVSDFVVCNDQQQYQGMVVGQDLRTTLLQREAVPLMIVGELMRTDLPTVTRDETLDGALDKFARYDVASLAVVDQYNQVLGLITRDRLIRKYHEALGTP